MARKRFSKGDETMVFEEREQREEEEEARAETTEQPPALSRHRMKWTVEVPGKGITSMQMSGESENNLAPELVEAAHGRPGLCTRRTSAIQKSKTATVKDDDASTTLSEASKDSASRETVDGRHKRFQTMVKAEINCKNNAMRIESDFKDTC